jgi:excisionase family DNA binding protein
MTRRTEITIETHRLLVVRRHGVSVRAWCERCSAKVEMITPPRAAEIAGVSSRTIYRWIEDAKLHFTEEGGHVFVCANSLQVNSRGLG